MTNALLRRAALLAPVLLAAPGFAQHSLVFNSQTDEVHFDPVRLTLLGDADDDALSIVTPVPGTPYSAHALLPRQVQWMLVGDQDGDGEFVESSTNGPLLAMDAAFAKPMAPNSTIDPREIFFSMTSTSEMVGSATVRDGDVFRLPAPSTVEWFLNEDQVVGAIGGAVGVDEVDVNAMCQSASGDLFLSFDATETVNGVPADDGGIVMIPSAAITYDASGNVSAITAGTAVIVATEADVDAWIAAAAVASFDGTAFTAIVDLGGLEIDPAGGTFNSPVDPTLSIPNLLFTSTSSTSDGAIFSTTGGGTIAVINGVTMGSPVATTGRQIGLLPDSSGVSGVGGLALVPAQSGPPKLAVNALEQDGTSTDPAYSLFLAQGMTPGGQVIFALDIQPLSRPSWSELTAPGLTGSAVVGFGILFVIGTTTADSDGFAWLDFYPPRNVLGSDLAVVVNALDFATLSFATPGVFQY